VGNTGKALISNGSKKAVWGTISGLDTNAVSIDSLPYWSLTGNSGTTSANFVGTTDGQPLVLKSDSQIIFKIGSDTAFKLPFEPYTIPYFDANGNMTADDMFYRYNLFNTFWFTEVQQFFPTGSYGGLNLIANKGVYVELKDTTTSENVGLELTDNGIGTKSGNIYYSDTANKTVSKIEFSNDFIHLEKGDASNQTWGIGIYNDSTITIGDYNNFGNLTKFKVDYKNELFSFNKHIQIDDGSEGAGKILKSDSNGVASWVNIGGKPYEIPYTNTDSSFTFDSLFYRSLYSGIGVLRTSIQQQIASSDIGGLYIDYTKGVNLQLRDTNGDEQAFLIIGNSGGSGGINYEVGYDSPGGETTTKIVGDSGQTVIFRTIYRDNVNDKDMRIVLNNKRAIYIGDETSTGNNTVFAIDDSLELFSFNKSVKIADGTQSNGYVLTSDASGNSVWGALGSGNFSTIPSYADNTAAFAVLGAGKLYYTNTGGEYILKVTH